MRYFLLENSVGDRLDITTTEFLFHDIEGLGFEEEVEFRRIGPVWRLNSAKFNQTHITGKMCLTDNGDTTPYQKYEYLRGFISRAPLTLIYYPHGYGTTAYRKRVRVTSITKTEINKYGVLDDSIDFTPYTPWYEAISVENVPEEVDENAKWIWDIGYMWRDSENDPISGTGIYKFGGESRNNIDIECTSNAKGLIKLSIFGPIQNPSWFHYVDGVLVADGGFSSVSQFELLDGECLTIDNTDGEFKMTVINLSTGVSRNVYSLRDFDKTCFFTLREGLNTLAVRSEDSTPVKIKVEGQIHYATV